MGGLAKLVARLIHEMQEYSQVLVKGVGNVSK